MNFKKSFAIVSLMLCSIVAMAQKITPVLDPEAKTISILVDTDFECYGVGFKFYLPEGVTVPLYENDDEEMVPNIVKGKRAKSSTTLSVKNPEKGYYSLNLYNTDSSTLKSDKTAYAIIINLSGELKGSVKFDAIAFSDKDAKSYEQDAFTLELESTGIQTVSVSDSQSSTAYSVSGIKANKMQKGQLYIVDGKKFLNK